MANTNFFLNDLSAVDAPEVFLDRVLISHKSVEQSNFNISRIPESPLAEEAKVLNFRLRFKIFDNYNAVTETGLWFNNPTLTKFLKFKVIFFRKIEEAEYFAKNPYETTELKDPSIKIYSFDDFKIEDEKINLLGQKNLTKRERARRQREKEQNTNNSAPPPSSNNRTTNNISTVELPQQVTNVETPEGFAPFYLYTDINIDRYNVEDIENLAVLVMPFLDQTQISQEFSISLEDTLDVQKFFYGVPKTFVLVLNRNLPQNPQFQLLNLTTVTQLKERFEFEIVPAKYKNNGNYFSDFFATPDVIDFSQETATQNNTALTPEQEAGVTALLRRSLGSSSTASPSASRPLRSLNATTNLSATNLSRADNTLPPNIIRFGFFFDKNRFVLENSVFPQLFSKQSPFYKRSIDKIQILDIKIARLRKNKITDNGGFEEEIIINGINNPTRKGVLYSYPISNLSDLTFFSGFDYDINKYTSGEYKYKAYIKVFDPTYEILLQFKQLSEILLAYTKNYKNIMDQPIIQYNELKDANPHIDINLENDIFVFKRYGLNTIENRYEYNDQGNILGSMINTISEAFLLLYTILSATRENVLQAIQNFAAVAKALSDSILPPYGNPETTKIFIESLELFIKKIDDILVSASPTSEKNFSSDSIPAVVEQLTQEVSGVPYFFKTLEYENTFENFSFDVDSMKNLYFDYHTTKQNFNNGLQLVEVKNLDIFEPPFKGGDLFKSLKAVQLPLLNNTEKIFKVKIRENIVVPNGTSTATIIPEDSAQFLDYILTLADTNEYNSLITGNRQVVEAFLNSRAANDSRPFNENTIVQNLAKAFLQGFDILTENKISSAATAEDLNSFGSETEFLGRVSRSANLSDRTEIYRNSEKLIEAYQKRYKNLSLATLNYSQLNADLNSPKFLDEIKNLPNREIFYYRLLREDTVSQFKLRSASLFKIINNTFKKAKYINFPILNTRPSDLEQEYNFEPFYVLKDPQMVSVKQTSAKGKYLGVLDNYIDENSKFFKNPFDNILVLNRYFLFDKEVVEASPTQPFIQEVASVRVGTAGVRATGTEQQTGTGTIEGFAVLPVGLNATVITPQANSQASTTFRNPLANTSVNLTTNAVVQNSATTFQSTIQAGVENLNKNSFINKISATTVDSDNPVAYNLKVLV
jgi:hypothetical protein